MNERGMLGRSSSGGHFRPQFSRLHEDRDLFWVVPFPVRYMVGVIGLRFAGKSAVLSHLNEKHGFRVYNLSSALREIAAQREVPLEPRARLQELGDELRAENGDAGYLARVTLRRIRADLLGHSPAPVPARIAIGGFKHPAEIDVFTHLRSFQLMYVKADERFRFDQAERSGVLQTELSAFPGQPAATIESFRRHIDRRDRHFDESPWTAGYGQQVDGVIELATNPDDEIENSGTLAELLAHASNRVAVLDAKFRGAGMP